MCCALDRLLGLRLHVVLNVRLCTSLLLAVCILATLSADDMKPSWRTEPATTEHGGFLKPLSQAVRDMYTVQVGSSRTQASAHTHCVFVPSGFCFDIYIYQYINV